MLKFNIKDFDCQQNAFAAPSNYIFIPYGEIIIKQKCARNRRIFNINQSGALG